MVGARRITVAQDRDQRDQKAEPKGEDKDRDPEDKGKDEKPQPGKRAVRFG